MEIAREVKEENQLAVIVKESGLDQTKADYLLKRFTEYFAIADEWTRRANSIVINDENCDTEQGKFDMQMAHNGRRFLQDKRIAIEKARKELKEQSLREGKAIDGIANVLKALIIPIEKDLESKEKYVEIKFEREQEAKRAEIERRMEEKRIAEERAKEEARIAEEKRIWEENERLRKEALVHEKQMEDERREAEKKAREAQEKADAEKRLIEARAKKEREELEARLAAQVTCPKCGFSFLPSKTT